MNKINDRVSDSELLALIAQGNLEAKKILNDRYFYYCKTITKEFLDSHKDYGFSFDDFFNAAMLGYCRARNKFDYEKSDGFYPYFKVWAESEMKALVEEGNKFYLNENPKKFLSFDITYKSNEDPLCLSETCGELDDSIYKRIKGDELMRLLSNPKYKLSTLELQICIGLMLKRDDREIRNGLKIDYNKYRRCLRSIKSKIGRCLSDIIK